MDDSQRIDQKIAALTDWRGEMMAHLRGLIHQAVPGIREEWKWNSPVFTLEGQVCALGAFKDHVKVNFFRGASLEDPDQLFNAGLEAKNSRGIDLSKGETVDESALQKLLLSAVAFNRKSA